MQYAQGVPMVNAQGQLELMIPPQYTQQAPPQHAPLPLPPQHHQQQMHTPPQGGGQFYTFSTAPPPQALQVTAQLPKPPQPQTEFFVHEYSPPAEIKRAATPRRAVDSGPKNYSFANSTPEHFEEKRAKAEKKAALTASNSPASSNGANNSS